MDNPPIRFKQRGTEESTKENLETEKIEYFSKKANRNSKIGRVDPHLKQIPCKTSLIYKST